MFGPLLQDVTADSDSLKQFVQQRLVADIEQTVTVMDSPEGEVSISQKSMSMVPSEAETTRSARLGPGVSPLKLADLNISEGQNERSFQFLTPRDEDKTTPRDEGRTPKTPSSRSSITPIRRNSHSSRTPRRQISQGPSRQGFNTH